MKITSIHSRINLMLYITGFIFLLMLVQLYQTTLHQERLILKESRIQLQNESKSMIENKTEILKQVAYDYTFWDDFVKHLTPHDSDWYLNNITTILKSFRVDYVAVYDSSFNLVHEASTSAIESRSFITLETLQRLKEKRFLNFFQKTPEGLFEISAASVHLETDSTHLLTRPNGYLFLSRNWNQNYLAGMSKQRGAKIMVVSANDTLTTQDEAPTNIAFVPLTDWKNEVIAKISVERSSTLLVLYRRSSLYMILTMLLAIIITWLILNYTIHKWVTRPLKLVAEILETEDASLVDKLKQSPGEFKQIGALCNDFVDQKKELVLAKEKAEESDLLKSAFLANMSHEIRTPMNGILGFVELLKEPKLTGEELTEYVGVIAESGNRMLNIINDIISISKVEAGHTELVISETNINDQLRYIFTFFKHEAEVKGLELYYKTALSDRKAHIRTDREKVYAVLTNLVKNAIKFTNRGFIEMGYEIKGEFLEFFVRDTGVGIRPDQQNMIFERFRQASESLARHYEGAGLGLAISKAYIEMLGGTIKVESELGKGSVFYFTLPYEPVTEIVTNLNAEEGDIWENLNISGLKILIAEDDLVSDLLLRKLIRPFAKEVLKVNTGNDAVEVCRKNPDIDLVLMDIQMPGMDGYEATRQIRIFNPKVIILAQTALGLKDEKALAFEAGCNDYLSKPIAVGDFSNLIRKYFENRL